METEKKAVKRCVFSAFAYDYNEKTFALLSGRGFREFIPKSQCKIVEGELQNSMENATLAYIDAPLWLYQKLKRQQFYDLQQVYNVEN